MKQLFNDIIGFMTNLNYIDLLLYIAILVLLILVVSLIYIIKTSEEEIVDSNNEETDIDLKEVVNNIITTQESVPTSTFTSYEKDQEEKAIISYEELLAKSKMGNINYNEEEILDDEILVKKIDLNNITSYKNENLTKSKESKLFRYTNEEAFLKALQKLNELLN